MQRRAGPGRAGGRGGVNPASPQPPGADLPPAPRPHTAALPAAPGSPLPKSGRGGGGWKGRRARRRRRRRRKKRRGQVGAARRCAMGWGAPRAAAVGGAEPGWAEPGAAPNPPRRRRCGVLGAGRGCRGPLATRGGIRRCRGPRQARGGFGGCPGPFPARKKWRVLSRVLTLEAEPEPGKSWMMEQAASGCGHRAHPAPSSRWQMEPWRIKS
nr:serine/arginine repetitive matrix protein 3-like isoform X2 [Taeniopygia guttata]